MGTQIKIAILRRGLNLPVLILGCVVSMLAAGRATAAEVETYREFEAYRVHYNAFDSTFITPQIAARHGLTRGQGRGLVSVSVVKNGETNGSPVRLEGRVNNLLAQQQNLNFVEISEGPAVYYLGAFRYDDGDVLTFKLQLAGPADSVSRDIVFQRRFMFK